MITKLDNPAKRISEVLAYTNTGSVSQLKNYLVADDEKLTKGEGFFNDKNPNINADDFYKLIDTNVKGLTKNDQKFFSFTLNPSEQELEHIGSDRNKLKEFVLDSMRDNYASSFAEKKDVQSTDLVWAAIIHEKRFYTNDDIQKYKKKNSKQPFFKAGDEKPNSMHAHVVISARNSQQTKSLTVLTQQYRLGRGFGLKQFQRKNEDKFQQKFQYETHRNLYVERQLKILQKDIENMQRYNPTIDSRKIVEIAKQMDYSPKFDSIKRQLIGLTKNGMEVTNLDLFFEKGLYLTKKNCPEIIQPQICNRSYSQGQEWQRASDHLAKFLPVQIKNASQQVDSKVASTNTTPNFTSKQESVSQPSSNNTEISNNKLYDNSKQHNGYIELSSFMTTLSSIRYINDPSNEDEYKFKPIKNKKKGLGGGFGMGM